MCSHSPFLLDLLDMTIPTHFIDVLFRFPKRANLSSPHRTEKDLPALSSLGHFLKGSSATLGLVKVRDACERIQHLGNLKENGDAQVGEQDNDWYLEKIKGTVAQVKVDYMAAEKVLKKFYHHE